MRRYLPYGALAALALIWGASFLFIKLTIHDMSPAILVLIRATTGFAALGLIMLTMRRRLFGSDWRSRIIPFAVMGIGGGLIPWAAFAWGEQHITSGLASILNATTPLWTAVLAYWVIPNERPTLMAYAGVAIGFAGVVILVLPKIISDGLSGDTLGTLVVLVAALSYAAAALYQRRKLRGVDPYQAALGQLALTAIVSLPFAVPTVSGFHLNLASLAAALVLGIAGSGVAYILYYYILNTLGPVRASSVTLLLPATAVFWGVVLLGETLSVPLIAGMVVILAGIVISNLKRRDATTQAREKSAA